MKETNVKIINKSKYPLPSYATTGSAGLDIYANLEEEMLVAPMQRVLVPTGLYIALEDGFEAQIRSRSGMSLKHGIVVANGIGTIDSDYRGEIKVILVNISNEDYIIKSGDKIAQMVINEYTRANFVEVTSLDETTRSDGGFGHSGM